MNQRPSVTPIVVTFTLAALIMTVPTVSILTDSLLPVWVGLGIFFGFPFLAIGLGMIADRRRHALTTNTVEDLAVAVLNEAQAEQDAPRRNTSPASHEPGYDPFK